MEEATEWNPEFASMEIIGHLSPENLRRMSSESRAFIFKKIECFTIYETSQEHLSTEMENSETLPPSVKGIEV